MDGNQCPSCQNDSTVSGSCFGAGGDSLAYRFVPDDGGGWWDAMKHILGAAGIAFGNEKFRLCTACGHVWIRLSLDHNESTEREP